MTRKQKVWAGCAQLVALLYGFAFLLHAIPHGHWAAAPTFILGACATLAAAGWTWTQLGYAIGVLSE